MSAKRIVFKPVLDSPYNYKWTTLSQQENEIFQGDLKNILEKEMKNLKYNQGKRDENIQNIPTGDKSIGDKTVDKSIGDKGDKTGDKRNKLAKRLNYFENHPRLVVGSNNITKLLQELIDWNQDISFPKELAKPPQIDAILICKNDTKISLLYSHIPTMAYLADPKIPVIALPSGAQATLSTCLDIPRPIVIALVKPTTASTLAQTEAKEVDNSEYDMLSALVYGMVPNPSDIPWLASFHDKNAQPSLWPMQSKSLSVEQGHKKSKISKDASDVIKIFKDAGDLSKDASDVIKISKDAGDLSKDASDCKKKDLELSKDGECDGKKRLQESSNEKAAKKLKT